MADGWRRGADAGRAGYHAGLAAEAAVERHYLARGLTVAARRWRAPRGSGGGEIDLVLRDGAALVFVEVKRSATHARAAHALRPAQAARLMASAEAFAGTQPAGLLTEMRIDLALVDGAGRVEVVENALGP